MNKLFRIVLVLAVLGVTGMTALGEDTKTTTTASATDQVKAPEPPMQMPNAVLVIGGCIGAALCTIGGAFAIARIGAKCIDSMARQPESAGTMFTSMIVAAAMVEGGMFFGILVCMMAVRR